MSTIPLQYLLNEAGKKVGVILPIEKYQALSEAWEELEDIRAYEEAMATPDEAIPFEQAIREIEL